jgi:uncharacterized membrane protein YdcZ (DUF606 family)
MRNFSPNPLLFCNVLGRCAYATRNDYSYWLSTGEKKPLQPFNSTDITKYVSRCAVCAFVSFVSRCGYLMSLILMIIKQVDQSSFQMRAYMRLIVVTGCHRTQFLARGTCMSRRLGINSRWTQLRACMLLLMSSFSITWRLFWLFT